MSLDSTLVGVVRSELDQWKAGQWVECVRDPVTNKPVADPALQPGSVRVAQYWREGVGDTQRNGCIDVAWSAAFICWSLRRAGVKLDRFPFSAGHHSYIRWAIANTRQAKPGKLYYGMRPNEYQPQPGDMIAQWRKAKPSDPDPDVSFDHQPDDFYASHCDIVVSASATQVVAVGGNLSNKVKESGFAAAGGILKPKRELICVLRLAP